jgi:hypothetical protein
LPICDSHEKERKKEEKHCLTCNLEFT